MLPGAVPAKSMEYSINPQLSRLSPIWEEFAKSSTGIKNFAVAKLDCSLHKEFCKSKKMRSYPTIKLYIEGLSIHFTGKRTQEEFFDFYKKAISQGDQGLMLLRTTSQVQQEEISKVAFLTTEGFSSSIQIGFWFVHFSAPWCGLCSSIAEEWRQLSLSHTSDYMHVSQVDCTEDKEVCLKEGINEYPSLVVYKDGHLADRYTGERTYSSLSKYLSDKFGIQGENQNCDKKT